MSETPVDRINAALSGRYRIERELGEGGMATVYLADDLKHERKVALKVLKPELAAVVGGDRFVAEIKTTANLQHPHILPLFDSGEADGFLYYVMPFIEGETLGDRLSREKQLPIDEALGIATAVANALQTAHDAGVVHRDIKPGNILMSRGEPLVADFGIALAVGSAGGSRLTETGLSVGTPYYMSPEQATGDQIIGPASDIFALACVLYEMLVGEPPYPGSTAQAVLGKIIQGVPVSATAVRTSIPANVDGAIRKALEKLPADRFTGAQEFARALADPSFRHGTGVGAAPAEGGGHWKSLALVAGGAAVAFAALSMWLGVRGTGSDQPEVPVFSAVLSDSAVGITSAAVARDGTVGHVRDGRIWLRPPGALEATPLVGAENVGDFDFSPDGRWVTYVTSSGALRKAQTLGGGDATLWESTSEFAMFPRWSDDGYVYYVRGSSVPEDLVRVPDVGGEAEVVLDWDGLVLDPDVLPGGRAVAMVVANASATDARIVVLDLASGDTTSVANGAFSPRWSETGHVLYAQNNGTVWALPFDPRSLEATGQPVPVLEGVYSSLMVAEYTVSPEGFLAYVEGPATGGGGGFDFVLMDLEGESERLPLPPSDHYDARVSPDGRKLAYTRGSDIWIFDMDRGSNDSLTSGSTGPHNPAWSPDGTQVIYDAGATMMVRPVDRSTPPREAGGTGAIDYPNQWLEDGTVIFQSTGGGGGDLYTISQEGGEPTALLDADWLERAAMVSPDGRWVAYVSARSGNTQVYVRSWPDLVGEVRESPDDAPLAQFGQPQWSPDGRTLYYHKGQQIYAADLDTSDGLRVTGVRETGVAINGWLQHVHPDGRLLVASIAGAEEQGEITSPRLIVASSWWTVLRERMGGGE